MSFLFIQDNQRREGESMYSLELTNLFIFDLAAARVTDWKIISPSVSFVDCQRHRVARWPGIEGWKWPSTKVSRWIRK
jgi:hypothetical protein